jgi:tRNA(Ile)-lysidine synthase
MPVSGVRAPSIRAAVRDAFRGGGTMVLAVSGGIDSMVLLDAAAHAVPRDRLRVATFDHRTGPAASAAAAFVRARARALGIACTSGRARRSFGAEAEWRRVRWSFLRSVARREQGAIATAHTRDDQLETVVMRVLRGAGARGLAGLEARSDVVRPLLAYTRADIEAYAARHDVEWIEDPSNASPAHFRNRVRSDLLPAMRRAHPSIDADLLAIARRAAEWRAGVEAFVRDRITTRVTDTGTAIDVSVADLPRDSLDGLRILWPAIAARVGLALDRRAVERLASFADRGRVGARVQIAGGWEAVRGRTWIRVHRVRCVEATSLALALSNATTWRDWIFRPAVDAGPASNWVTWLPTDDVLHVRAWQPGDAIVHRAERRKVKRLLSGAGITGHERAGWPVVTSGTQVVWVPGVRRSDAASDRSGRPGLSFACEHIDR